MAAGGMDDLCASFEKFALLANKDKSMLTPKACGKMVADCWDKEYKKNDVKSVVDASVYPTFKAKGALGMAINKDNCKKFVAKTAHEIAKRKTKNTKIAADDAEVTKINDHLCSLLCGGGPHVKEVKQSATGNVGGLTDTKHYTGAHKERFDDSGKGKGVVGRVDKVENSGYVGNYKGANTFDKKK